jgi:hypothetical protein
VRKTDGSGRQHPEAMRKSQLPLSSQKSMEALLNNEMHQDCKKKVTEVIARQGRTFKSELHHKRRTHYPSEWMQGNLRLFIPRAA